MVLGVDELSGAELAGGGLLARVDVHSDDALRLGLLATLYDG